MNFFNSIANFFKSTIEIHGNLNGKTYNSKTLILSSNGSLTQCNLNKCRIIIYAGGKTNDCSFKECTREYKTFPRNLTQPILPKSIQPESALKKSETTPASLVNNPNQKPELSALELLQTMKHMDDRHILTFPNGDEIMTVSWRGEFKLCSEENSNVIETSAITGLYYRPQGKKATKIDIYNEESINLNGIVFKYVPDGYKWRGIW